MGFHNAFVIVFTSFMTSILGLSLCALFVGSTTLDSFLSSKLTRGVLKCFFII